ESACNKWIRFPGAINSKVKRLSGVEQLSRAVHSRKSDSIVFHWGSNWRSRRSDRFVSRSSDRVVGVKVAEVAATLMFNEFLDGRHKCAVCMQVTQHGTRADSIPQTSKRLLEHESLYFKTACGYAKSLELARKQSLSFLPNNRLPCATVSNDPPKYSHSRASPHEQTTAASVRAFMFLL
ncbi:hypothetical protein X801_00127, partial [Opisthorchis viverrini]